MATSTAAAALGAVIFPAGSPGAVTIGSDLDHDPNLAPNLVSVGTYAQESLIAANTAPGGLTAPISGVVVRFRVKHNGAAAPDPIRFRVIRPLTPTMFTGAGTSDALPVPMTASATVFLLGARIPIAAGDRIGVDCCINSQHNITYRPPGPHIAEGSVYSWTVPALADGAPPTASNNGDPDLELLANADIEPDADGDGFGDETQDLCPTNAATQGSCPLVATPAVATSAKKRCKKGFRLKTVKTKSGKKKKKCVRKKKRRR